MILLEEHIELKILHHNNFIKFDVIEVLKDDDQVSFKVFNDGDYLFTLIPKNNAGLFSFELSQLDKDLAIDIDWVLYSKIEASLFSVFLKEDPS
ncbi:MAG: hypothetical protein QM791_17585 [Ferruginibacter sp.]